MSRPQHRAGGSFSLQLLEHRVGVHGDGEATFQLAQCFEPLDGGPADGEIEIGLEVHLSRVSCCAETARWMGVATDPAGVLGEFAAGGACSPLDLTRALVQWAVDNTAHYVFHAGAVRRGGRGILIPADSGSGKSTLTAALCRSGFALLSDEVGAIDRESECLIAFPRALSLRRDVLPVLGCSEPLGASFDGGASRMVRAKDLGLDRAASGARLALIVTPRFVPGAATRLERLATGPAMLALMKASCSQPRFKVAGLDFVIDLARRIPCYQLVFSDPWEAASRIEAAFDGAS